MASTFPSIVAALGLTAAAAYGQSLQMRGSIPCVGQLQLLGAAPEGAGPALRLRLVNPADLNLTLQAVVRTNCRYRLRAEWISGGDPSDTEVSVTPGEIAPLSGNGRLTPRALDAQLTRNQLAPGRSGIWAEGPRVSRGGTNFSQDNAIRIGAVLSVRSKSPVIIVQITLDLADGPTLISANHR